MRRKRARKHLYNTYIFSRDCRMWCVSMLINQTSGTNNSRLNNAAVCQHTWYAHSRRLLQFDRVIVLVRARRSHTDW